MRFDAQLRRPQIRCRALYTSVVEVLALIQWANLAGWHGGCITQRRYEVSDRNADRNRRHPDRCHYSAPDDSARHIDIGQISHYLSDSITTLFPSCAPRSGR
jgi:hypothetical protein